MRQALLFEQRASLRRLSICVEISLGETRHIGEFVGFARRVLRLAARNRKAVRRIGDGIGKETLKWQVAAERFPRPIEREFPAANSSGDRVRRERATKRNRVETLRTIIINRSRGCRAAAGFYPDGRRAGRRDQPETVAADAIHMRIGDRDRGSGRDHCFDGVAAITQNCKRALRGERTRRHSHSARGAQGTKNSADTIFFPHRVPTHFHVLCVRHGRREFTIW